MGPAILRQSIPTQMAITAIRATATAVATAATTASAEG